MARTADKSPLVREIVLEYLKMLYQKECEGSALTKEEMESTTTIDNLGKAVFRYGKGKIIEKGMVEKPEKDIKEVSSSTVYNVIKSLQADGKIEWFDGKLHYKEPDTEENKRYPILKIADQIPVTPLPYRDVAFYRVGERYSAWVAEYINSRFHCGDIVAVNMGQIVMCIDLEVPKGATSVTKKEPLEKRVGNLLRGFSLKDYWEFDDSDGYSEEELEQMRVRQNEKCMRRELNEPGWGGKIEKPLKRKVRKKK